MVNAAGISILIVCISNEKPSGEGTEVPIRNRSPIVSTVSTPAYVFNRYTAVVITTMATSEPGTFFDSRGVKTIMAMLTTPTPAVHKSMELICPK